MRLSILLTFFTLFLASLSLWGSPTFVYAQSSLSAQMVKDINATLNTKTQTTSNSFQQIAFNQLSAASCWVAGIDIVLPGSGCLTPHLSNGQLTYSVGQTDPNNTVLGFLTTGISSLYQMPVSSSDYIAYLQSSFIVHPAYADGIGLNGLKVFSNIWINFRNICLSLFILVLVFVGFAIMFRMKIDQRTVIGLENQLPKLIIGLLLINFSLAIAGFMIDMMYVVTNVIYNDLSSIPNTDLSGMSPYALRQASPFSAVNQIKQAGSNPGTNGDNQNGIVGVSYDFARNFNNEVMTALGLHDNGGADAVLTAVGGTFGGIVGVLTQGAIRLGLAQTSAPVLNTYSPFDLLVDLASFGIVDSIASQFGDLTSQQSIAATSLGLIGYWAGWTSGQGLARIITTGLTGGALNLILRIAGTIAVLWFLMMLALTIALVRIWFNLLIAYVKIILFVIFSPFIILFGLIPHGGLGFKWWLQQLGAALFLFPTTLGMFLLANVILQAFFHIPNGTPVFSPYLLGNPGGTGDNPNNQSNIDLNSLGYLFFIGILLIMGQLPTFVNSIFGIKAQKNNPFSSLFSTAFMGISWLTTGITVIQKYVTTLDNDQYGGSRAALGTLISKIK